MSRSALLAALVAASVTSVTAASAQPAPPDPSGSAAPAAPAAPPPAGAAGGAEAPAEAPAPVLKLEASPATAKDVAQASPSEEKEESKLPFRGSTFLFDQSMSTQTAHLETSPQQSYVPLYEWWVSFRPRYYFTDKIYVSGRFDYYKELTNSEQTDKYREDVFGDIWTDLGYTTPVPAISKNTKVSVAARFKWPTSKESQAMGMYVNAGVSGSVKQTIPLKGESAPFLNEAHFALGAYYNHPFTRATSPTKGDFGRIRQDADEHSFVSDQVRGGMITNHSLITSLDSGLQITPKLSATLDMIFISSWKYTPKQDPTVATLTGPAQPTGSPNDTHYGLNTWFIASVDYDLFDELSLGLGYYNLATALGPDGQRRGIFSSENVWWSPDARVFFDVTANLDKIYEFASGRKKNTPKSSTKAASTPLPSTFTTSQAL